MKILREKEQKKVEKRKKETKSWSNIKRKELRVREKVKETERT